MAVTSKALILRDIRSTFEAVSIANGFKTDVTTVEEFLRSRDEVETGNRPLIGFGADQETYEHHMGNVMRVQLPWTAVGYIRETDSEVWDDSLDTINDLRDDIIAAIMADHTLGGSATQTLLLSDLDDTADPNRRDISEDGGAVVLNFMTTYYRTTGSS